jgi:hypothetical protein
MQPPADRKVAAEFVEKQHARVINAMDDLIKLQRLNMIRDIAVLDVAMQMPTDCPLPMPSRCAGALST